MLRIIEELRKLVIEELPKLGLRNSDIHDFNSMITKLNLWISLYIRFRVFIETRKIKNLKMSKSKKETWNLSRFIKIRRFKNLDIKFC